MATNKPIEITSDLEKMFGIVQGLALRQTVALETIARRLGTIEEALLSIVDGNNKSLRMKDIERGKVYATNLGKNLRK